MGCSLRTVAISHTKTSRRSVRWLYATNPLMGGGCIACPFAVSCGTVCPNALGIILLTGNAICFDSCCSCALPASKCGVWWGLTLGLNLFWLTGEPGQSDRPATQKSPVSYPAPHCPAAGRPKCRWMQYVLVSVCAVVKHVLMQSPSKVNNVAILRFCANLDIDHVDPVMHDYVAVMKRTLQIHTLY
ncbi:hypothetical protein DM02DRAFT_259770 [Periconia macrospinosa]|uniref:Uncharacterized protein n=1 Tax=Periconia macrospinosa TaxID=97972 RepID=A0A2V1D5V1_9PLEO|nr:hypothetical protein DM02DRAFT_259770 [Periconia macrospinosa]